MLGVDPDVAAKSQRAAIAQQDEALGVDVRRSIEKVQRTHPLGAAVKVEDRRLGGIVDDEGGGRVELLAETVGDADHAGVDVGVATDPGRRDRHGDRPDARTALRNIVTLRAREHAAEGGVGIIRTEAGITSRSAGDKERAGTSKRTNGIAARHRPGRTRVDRHRNVADTIRVTATIDRSAADKSTGRDDERSGESVVTSQRKGARSGLGETAGAADDAVEGEGDAGRGDFDRPHPAGEVESVAVRRGRRAAAHGAGHTGIAEGRAAGDEDGLGDAETERTGTRGGGVAEGQHAAVDEGVVGVGIRAAEHGHTGAGHDKVGQLRTRREILDTRRDGQGRGGVVMDDEVASRRAAARAGLEAARGRGADGEGVGAREKQAAEAGAEGDVVGAEREGLAGGRGRDLQGADRSRDRLGLRGGEEAVGGGRAGGGVRQADVRTRSQTRQDERSRAAGGGQPVEVDAVGEHRAAGADDAVGRDVGRGGDLRVDRGGEKERAGVRAAAGAEAEGAEVEAGDVGVAGDDRNDAAVPIDVDRAERLRRGKAGTTAHREDGSALQREGRVAHERGLGAAVGEIEQEGAALERGGAGVIAGDRRREGERAAAELGDVETVGGRGGERAGEGGARVVAAERESRCGRARRIQDEAGAAERADELAGVVEVESRAGGHGERAAVRQDVAGLGAEGALVDERGAAVAVVAGREQQDAGTGLDDVAARDERAGDDVRRARAGESDVRLAGTQAS